MKNREKGKGGEEDLLHLNDLTVLMIDTPENPFQDIQADSAQAEETNDDDGTLCVDPEEWLED